MVSNRFTLVALALACVTAAAGGSYLATRHNMAEVASPTASAAPAPAGALTPTVSRPTPATETLTVSADTSTRSATADQPTKSPDTRPAPSPGHPIASSAATPRNDDERASNEQRTVSTPPAAAPATPAAEEPLPARATADSRAVAVPRPPEAPTRTFEELVVASESVIGLQTEGLLTSERARVEDRVEARVTRDVRVGGEIAIPAGTRALGTVVVVDRGGRVRERARLGIRFHTLQLADGTRLPIATETIYRYGDAPSNGSAAKIGGGAVAGAILGAIIGGGKGAAIGATTGAGAGTAAVMTGERSAAVFPPGGDVTARILSPVTITIERE